MPGPPSVPLPGSDRSPVSGARPAGPLDSAARIEVTLITRRRSELPPEAVAGPSVLTRGQLAGRHGSDPSDTRLVREVMNRHGIEVTEVDSAGRRIKVAGTVSALAAVFGTTLTLVRGETTVHRHREGSLSIPVELDGVVLAVLGLDDRPQASPHLRWAPATAQRPGSALPAVSYTPVEVASLYGFPPGTDGSGQTMAIIELGGGFSQSDLDPYFAGLGIATPTVTAIGVDGAVNVPGGAPSGADGEVLLDIEVAGAVAPGAHQFVYFAPNTDQGFVDAVTTAVHATPTPAVVSISWGQSEDSWTAQARSALDAAIADAAALGVTVCVAAGDGGSSDGQPGGRPHVDFPASSPHALACGGTSLRADVVSGTITSETVWNDGPGGGATGGGVSDVFGVPSWQSAAGVPARPGGGTGRGVPDVAGNADPQTGYQVLVDGRRSVIGGTSAVAPLWAALICRMTQARGNPFGLIQPLLYTGTRAGADPAGFRDVTTGDNGAYHAAVGWDPCTGLGSPEGTALLARLTGGQAAVSTRRDVRATT